ncbi:metallophosphoesterase domain containing 2 [Rhodopirellula maiorica SM1]|uniref:Metallophosphoesterase domain containing 2 n=1 Tax=Rhodopirellula maiorica SM1 TaxID=1265738 RepID=M5RM09_9BACT|nr:metallophosphoesterase [Rhodopirellula maiorica]EMI20236.1 metallophosphoesterase domain containing 2 [Rhodopirellula maiorica SM1]
MKIWFISDTHNEHLRLQVPEVDIVIHCGDESTDGDATKNEPEARRFFDWYSELNVPTKVFVPGNHSTAVEQGLIRAEEYPDIRFLVHESMHWNSLHLFGSPYTPRFHDWAYMKKRKQLDHVWQAVPDDVDILITHTPPKGVLDLTHDKATKELIQVGCMALRHHVEQRIKPQIHAFGHLHDEKGISNYGIFTRGATQFINCSCCNLAAKLTNNGFVIEL